MISYDSFKNIVIESFLDYLPKDSVFEGVKLSVSKVNKVNCVLDGVTIVIANSRFAPVIYIEQMYEYYKQCDDMRQTLSHFSEVVVDAVDEISSDAQSMEFDFENMKSNIVFKLVNTNWNEGMLSSVPNRPFNDLSIVYTLIIDTGFDGSGTAIITNKLAKVLGLSESDLYELAVNNTSRILKPTVLPMGECFKKCIGSDFEGDGVLTSEDIDLIKSVVSNDDTGMWVITSSNHLNGACVVLCPGVLSALATKLEDDLYLLPSSIHEFIAVKASSSELRSLLRMVPRVNVMNVSPNAQLSNGVYFYDRAMDKVCLATSKEFNVSTF